MSFISFIPFVWKAAKYSLIITYMNLYFLEFIIQGKIFAVFVIVFFG
jgi:hypothetical protein